MSSQPSRKIDRLVHLCVVAIVALVGFVGGAALSFGPIAEAAVTQAAARAEAAAGAATPSIFSYQGVLRKPDGTLENGIFKMKFSIYANVAGGDSLHTETIDQVAVRDGIFYVVLGDNANEPIAPGVFDETPRYLGITVGDDAEMVPRLRINAVPYALTASTAHRLVGGGVLEDALIWKGATDIRMEGPGDFSFDFQNTDGSTAWVVYGSGAEVDYLKVHNGPKGPVEINADVTVNGAKPIQIIRMINLGNDSGSGDGRKIPGMSAEKYECVAAGWAAKWNGGLFGGNDSANRVWTHKVNSDWYVKVEFASYDEHENPDVDIVCFAKEIAAWSGAGQEYNNVND